MKRAGESKPDLKTRFVIGAVAATALISLYVGGRVGDWTQKVEPIRIPSDAVTLSGDQDPSKRFRTKAENAASVFCGKVVQYFIFIDPIEKYVTETENGNAIVECDTAGMNIPIERTP